MLHNRAISTYKPQHRQNRHTAYDKKYCTWCHPTKGSVNTPTAAVPAETICSNPYALQILSQKTPSKPKMMTMMIREGVDERVTVGKKSRRRKGNSAGRDYYEEMDLDQARLINWETDQNFERDDVFYADTSVTEDQIVHREFLRTVFPGFRELDDRLERGRGYMQGVGLGSWVSDQELRDMGLLYDSEEDEEHEHVMEDQGPATPVACTPYITAMSLASDSDLDELWELVEGRRLPVEMRGEWDIISEF
ncbi:hypothetical protein TWF718_002563 [Orbilia javanica]|uniref:Uncharacterized protein n=1 Tax=Orbilia javanica TaxID=47235 RepID=A0AAN8RCJ2_9PEZI